MEQRVSVNLRNTSIVAPGMIKWFYIIFMCIVYHNNYNCVYNHVQLYVPNANCMYTYVVICIAMHAVLIILQCNNPAYSGNGTVCARDSDEDTLPDVNLGCDQIICEMVCTVHMYSINQLFYNLNTG